MTLGPNTLHPLLLEDARSAAHQASELQRQCEDRIRSTSRDLAEAERAYRHKLSVRIVELRSEGVAVTMCGEIARGEKEVSDLRFTRDVAAGVHEAAKQESFRRGADRRDLHQMLRWSMAREMRLDPTPAGVDPRTGELVA